MKLIRSEHIREITRAFSDNGMGGMLSYDSAERFCTLTELMLTENEKYNLTAITEPGKIALMHYADCATLSPLIPKGATLCDIGCGAGFPSLPLAILRPDIKITGVDARGKRIDYVSHVAEELGLTNITAICERAEELALTEARESFDIVTARAVAAMPVLTELCLPLVRVGGKFLAMKGKNGKYELKDAARAIATLGGATSEFREITLKGGEDMTHPVIIIDKLKKTPKGYPRSFSQISKRPI